MYCSPEARSPGYNVAESRTNTFVSGHERAFLFSSGSAVQQEPHVLLPDVRWQGLTNTGPQPLLSLSFSLLGLVLRFLQLDLLPTPCASADVKMNSEPPLEREQRVCKQRSKLGDCLQFPCPADSRCKRTGQVPGALYEGSLPAL